MHWDSRVATAGAFVWNRGRLVFMVGPTRAGDRLGIVRLGGHRERGESMRDCALREVLEEASLAVELLRPPATYFAGAPLPMPGRPLPAIDWAESPAPLLVTQRADGTLAAIYLAASQEEPVPAAETKGLLLPDRAWLARLCARPYTLKEYQHLGGEVILRTPMPGHLPLDPSPQLRLFARILAIHGELFFNWR